MGAGPIITSHLQGKDTQDKSRNEPGEPNKNAQRNTQRNTASLPAAGLGAATCDWMRPGPFIVLEMSWRVPQYHNATTNRLRPLCVCLLSLSLYCIVTIDTLL